MKNTTTITMCAGCNLLFEATRKDTLTCSGSCRVRAHRNGSLKTLHTAARTMKVRPGMIQQCRAIQLLRPDLYEQIGANKLEVHEAQPEMCKAFIRLVCDAVRT